MLVYAEYIVEWMMSVDPGSVTYLVMVLGASKTVKTWSGFVSESTSSSSTQASCSSALEHGRPTWVTGILKVFVRKSVKVDGACCGVSTSEPSCRIELDIIPL